MSTKTNIFMTGVTGYIGGSVLSLLLAEPDVASLNINALVRSSEKAAKLETLGVRGVVGSQDDAKLVEKLASEADIVISTADSDHLEAARSMLRGIKKRFNATGVKPILIHTSGTGVLVDDAKGLFSTETIYDDANPDQIETLAITQPHRNVDVELVEADRQGYVATYIIVPSTIYGIANNQLVESGIQNPYSIQVPQLIRASLDRGQGGVVGPGKNIWNHVHITELADLYLVLYKFILANPGVGHGREGFYFGENGEYTGYRFSKAVAEALAEFGKGSPVPTVFTEEEIKKYFEESPSFARNSRGRANRSKAIGWKPVKTLQDFLDSIKSDVEVQLQVGN